MASLPPSDPALIEVRHDEQLDLTHLEPWLRTHLPHTEGPLSVRQFGGGRANLTYLIRFGAHEYVLRRPPLGPIAPTSHDMQREHRVLKQLGTAFPLAPTSFALCDDPAVLGVDFHVMERRHGIVIRGELPTIVQQGSGHRSSARRDDHRRARGSPSREPGDGGSWHPGPP